METIANPLIAAIAARLPPGQSLTSLAKAAGLADTTLTKKRADRHGGLSTRTVEKVAAILDCTAADLHREAAALQGGSNTRSARPAARRSAVKGSITYRLDVPVRGTAAGSALNGFEITDQVTEYVARPPALEGVEDAYAIFVVSESMRPKHSPGDLCFVHPHRMARKGDSVIIQTRAYDGAPIEAYIKTFVKEAGDEIIAEQLNPVATLRYKRKNVFQLHKVLTLNELFGV